LRKNEPPDRAGFALQKQVWSVNYLDMKLSVTFDRDEDGIWVAECPAIPGCVSQGKTKAEAMDNIKEAITLCLEVRAEREIPVAV
jgi:predicted RNase H-like HicB family nuclease